MGILGRSKKEDVVANATALVVQPDVPPEKAPKMGRGSQGVIGLWVDAPGRQRIVQVQFRYNADRWLVLGEDAPVQLDPAHPEKAEIAWGALPSMAERAAAQIKPLVDPIATSRKVMALQGFPDKDEPDPDALQDALKVASKTDAPAGFKRAIVVVSTLRGVRWSAGTDDGADSTGVTREKDSDGVFSVNIPGQAPYAVFKRLKFARHKSDIDLPGLPALVSDSDPDEFEILWDEVPSNEKQVGQIIADRLAGAGQPQFVDPSISTSAPGFSGGGAAPAQPPAGQMPQGADMQQLAAEQAKMALQYISDPAQRAAMIAQYKAAGVDLGDIC